METLYFPRLFLKGSKHLVKAQYENSGHYNSHNNRKEINYLHSSLPPSLIWQTVWQFQY